MKFPVTIDRDEDGVRRTFQDWLAGVPDLRVFVAADAEAALVVANEHPIDLAVLVDYLAGLSIGLHTPELEPGEPQAGVDRSQALGDNPGSRGLAARICGSRSRQVSGPVRS